MWLTFFGDLISIFLGAFLGGLLDNGFVSISLKRRDLFFRVNDSLSTLLGWFEAILCSI